jgi:hypothetical protein
MFTKIKLLIHINKSYLLTYILEFIIIFISLLSSPNTGKSNFSGFTQAGSTLQPDGLFVLSTRKEMKNVQG